MTQHIWQQQIGDGPLLAAAVHDGHEVREEVAELLALDEMARLREEDPFTGQWTAQIVPTQIVGLRSRFEVDLNRPREQAVYRTPEDAWGLKVWKSDPPDDVVNRSLAEYDAFYAAVQEIMTNLQQRYGRFFVFDLHTYNHRRNGPHDEPADAAENPQVNIGTGAMDRERWAPIVDRFIADLQAYDFPGGRLDVRENVKFRGGHFSQWIHETFPQSGCALAIEFKKFFMNEWTGEPDSRLVRAIGDALRSTVRGVLEELKRL